MLENERQNQFVSFSIFSNDKFESLTNNNLELWKMERRSFMFHFQKAFIVVNWNKLRFRQNTTIVSLHHSKPFFQTGSFLIKFLITYKQMYDELFLDFFLICIRWYFVNNLIVSPWLMSWGDKKLLIVSKFSISYTYSSRKLWIEV